MKTMKSILILIAAVVCFSGSGAQDKLQKNSVNLKLNSTLDQSHCDAVPAGIAQLLTGRKTVQFFALLVQDGQSFVWDFGDGQKSNVQNPSHTYLRSGRYVVTLTVSSVCGLTASSRILVVIDQAGSADANDKLN